MKYALFAGICYYPNGGAEDFQGFGTIDELKAKHEAYREKAAVHRDATWAHICDESLAIVLELNGDGVWIEKDGVHDPH
jgi:hypothetical protein